MRGVVRGLEAEDFNFLLQSHCRTQSRSAITGVSRKIHNNNCANVLCTFLGHTSEVLSDENIPSIRAVLMLCESRMSSLFDLSHRLNLYHRVSQLRECRA